MVTSRRQDESVELTGAVARVSGVHAHVGIATTASIAGRYAVRRALGSGATGEVYEVLDTHSGRVMALKTLRTIHPDALLRFKREFRALAELDHPGIVSPGELGEHDGTWFLTMELVTGTDFLDYARACDEAALRAALARLGDALAYLHERGRVHRDIKPSNVLVDPSGRVVLVDFGLVAEGVADDVPGSITKDVVGTPLYMAPEQASATPIGPAADLYAVGAMLYEVLAGRPPFVGSLLAVMLDKQTKRPSAPSECAAGVPPDLDALSVALLAHDPAARPGTDALRALAGDAVRAPTSAMRPRGGGGVFVGRRRELAELGDAFEASRTRATIVVVEGDSGAGKSALARRFAEDARHDGALVLLGRCSEREAVPYQALDGAIDGLVRHLLRWRASDVAKLVPRSRAASALVKSFPTMRSLDAFARVPILMTVVDASEQRRMTFSALREVLARIAARTPIVFVIDDLQWADRDSATALEELLVPDEAPPALWVFTCRRGAPRPELPGAPRTIAVGGLAREDAIALASTLGCSDAAAETISDETRGHPMFVQELALHGGVGANVRSLDDALARRVAAESVEVRTLVARCALAGCPLPRATAWLAAELDGDRGSAAIARALAERWLRVSDGSNLGALEPYHDRVRENVLRSLGASERHEGHRVLASAFDEGPLAETRPDVHAVHLLEAGRLTDARAAFVRAGKAALAASAFETAVDAFERAHACGAADDEDRAALLEALGEARANVGRVVEATDALLEAASRGGAEDALRRRTRAGRLLLDTGDVERARLVLEPILGAHGESWPRLGFVFYVRFVLAVLAMPYWRSRAARTDVGPEAHPESLGALLCDLSMRVATTDWLTAHWFALRALRRAIHVRSAGALGRAAALLAATQPDTREGDQRWFAIVARCERLVPDDLTLRGTRLMADAMHALFSGSISECTGIHERFCETAARLPPEALHAELRVVRGMASAAAFSGAAGSDVATIRSLYHVVREAVRRKDPLNVVFLGEFTGLSYASLGDVAYVREMLRLGAEALPFGPPGIRDTSHIGVALSVAAFDRKPPGPLGARFDAIMRSPLSIAPYGEIALPYAATYGLVAAIRCGVDVEVWKKRARRVLRRYGRLPSQIGTAYYRFLEVTSALAEGRRDAAAALLRASALRSGANGLVILAAIDRHALGRLIAGDEGAALVADAERDLARMGIVDPYVFATFVQPLAVDASPAAIPTAA